MLNIVLFGPPGAGKGTQSVNLIKKYDLVHLSTGDIFRANIKGGTELGNLAKSYMDQGQLVPDSVTISMLESEVDKHSDPRGFIFDGFPRTPAQAKALDEFLNTKGTSITLMLALEVEEEELKKRLLLRGAQSDRADDKDPAVIQKRIDVYRNETEPVKDFYQAQNKYCGIEGVGSIDAIFERLCQAIDVNTQG
jgi:adenylate kinase